MTAPKKYEALAQIGDVLKAIGMRSEFEKLVGEIKANPEFGEIASVEFKEPKGFPESITIEASKDYELPWQLYGGAGIRTGRSLPILMGDGAGIDSGEMRWEKGALTIESSWVIGGHGAFVPLEYYALRAYDQKYIHLQVNEVDRQVWTHISREMVPNRYTDLVLGRGQDRPGVILVHVGELQRLGLL